MSDINLNNRINWIVKVVSDFYGIEIRLIFSKSRRQDIVEARHILAYCLREKYRLSFPVLGKILNRDHTSIMHACENSITLIANNKEVNKLVKSILKKDDGYLDEIKEQDYLSDLNKENKELVIKKIDTKNNSNLNYKNFLPEYDSEVKKFGFPIGFNDEYIEMVMKNLRDRTARIIINRYGLLSEDYSTLEIIAQKEGITRERVRQIASKGINKIFYKNYGGVRQIIIAITGRVFNREILDLNGVINDYYLTTEKTKINAIKFLLLTLLPIKTVVEFELSGVRFLINSLYEGDIIKSIDKIKDLIKEINSNAPDSIDNKWEYILGNLKLYDFFENNKWALNDVFLRACYDNYLFESQIVRYKTESLKKYKTISNKSIKMSGVPDEYKIFFE